MNVSNFHKLRINNDFEARFSYGRENLPSNFYETMSKLDENEKTYLKFLYAYLPTSDIATYDPELFAENVQTTIAAIQVFKYCIKVPEEIILNYVIQNRVSDENLEKNRAYFYEALRSRVFGKNAREAALEINYWTLEKLELRPKYDIGRTLGAIALTKSGFGGYNELTVFLVTALRSVGIPARKIYVPKWSQSDFVWVEAYIEGRWQYLSPCEPKENLNSGSGGDAAKNSVFVASHVFSPIISSEDEVINLKPFCHDVNRVAFYATQYCLLKIKIINAPPNASLSARITLTRDAMFRDAIKMFLEAEREVCFNIAKGAFLLRVSDGYLYMQKALDLRGDLYNNDELIIDFSEARKYLTGETVILSADSDYKDLKDLYLYEGEELEAQEYEESAKHKARVINANEAREYAGFRLIIDNFDDVGLCKRFYRHLDITEILRNARGNVNEILKFLKTDLLREELDVNVGKLLMHRGSRKARCLLLRYLDPKDLLDITASTLAGVLFHAYRYHNNFYEKIFAKYVLNPRIASEPIGVCGKVVWDEVHNGNINLKKAVLNPIYIWEWINKNISDAENEFVSSHSGRTLLASAEGALRHKKGEEQTRKILFVAIARVFGIPARINSSSNLPEIWQGGAFVTAIKGQEEFEEKKRFLKIECNEVLIYGQNYGLAQLKAGMYESVKFDKDVKPEFELSSGHYCCLVSAYNEETRETLTKIYFIELDNVSEFYLRVEIPKFKKIKKTESE